jgi:hypothetical protein
MTMTQEEADILLLGAAKSGDNQKVRAALDADAAIDVVDDSNVTALIWAAYCNHSETCQLLLEKGANIHAVDANGNTALIWAAHFGYNKICQLLLENGADINAVDNGGDTALLSAGLNGKTETCQFLLRQGAAVPTTFTKGKEDLAETFANYLAEMKASAQKAFPIGQKPAREACISAEGKPTDAVLNACATGQFAALVAAPLLRTKNPDDRKLFLDIYKSLPKHWQNQEAALYLIACRGSQPQRQQGRGI